MNGFIDYITERDWTDIITAWYVQVGVGTRILRKCYTIV